MEIQPEPKCFQGKVIGPLRGVPNFSAAKAAQGMQMSVNPSVILSVCHAYLFVRFISIFYNSKSDRNETKAISKHYKT